MLRGLDFNALVAPGPQAGIPSRGSRSESDMSGSEVGLTRGAGRSTGCGTDTAIPGSGVGRVRRAGPSTGSFANIAWSGCGVGPAPAVGMSTGSCPGPDVSGCGVGPAPAVGMSTGSCPGPDVSGCGVGPAPAAGMSTGSYPGPDSATRESCRSSLKLSPRLHFSQIQSRHPSVVIGTYPPVLSRSVREAIRLQGIDPGVGGGPHIADEPRRCQALQLRLA